MTLKIFRCSDLPPFTVTFYALTKLIFNLTLPRSETGGLLCNFFLYFIQYCFICPCLIFHCAEGMPGIEQWPPVSQVCRLPNRNGNNKRINRIAQLLDDYGNRPMASVKRRLRVMDQSPSDAGNFRRPMRCEPGFSLCLLL
jgi:hypothetical protein